MSLSREKSAVKNSIASKKGEANSQLGSCSTLEYDVVGEFKMMKEVLHNLFEEAKRELGITYKMMVKWVNETWEEIKSNREIPQKTVNKISEIRKGCETVMPELQNRLISVLLVPKLMIKNSQNRLNINPESKDEYFNTLNPENRRLKTSPSSTKIEPSSFMDGTMDKTSAYKIKPSHIKSSEDLKSLEENSDKLESIDLSGKNFLQSYKFSEFKAPNLQVLNLLKSDIIDLSCLKHTSFPSLTELNLSKNKIRNIDSLPETCLPKLIILNLSNNCISNIEPFSKCKFHELLELNISFNRLENAEVFSRCDFGNLEILNLDNNSLKNISSLGESIFYRIKVISFAHNLVTEINFLSKMSFKKLQAIIGHHNKITSIEPLSSASLPLLKEIVLRKEFVYTDNNLISDISPIKRMKFPQLTGFDLEFNNIKPQQIGCFVSVDKSYKEAKKNFPFLQI